MEESYPKLLEALLNRYYIKKDSGKYEVINAGVNGFRTEQECLYLKELGNRYLLDLVIVGLFINDISETKKFASTKNKIKRQCYFLSYLRGLYIVLAEIIGEGTKDLKNLELFQNSGYIIPLLSSNILLYKR